MNRLHLQSITGETLSRLVPEGLTQEDSLFVATLVPVVAIAQVKGRLNFNGAPFMLDLNL